ncbi:MAG: DNA-binding CsgD family transcriptional regulator [Cyclobacteriaceae bacterium]|jgi:DNA-binding CsgD family transcriptional regulator
MKYNRYLKNLMVTVVALLTFSSHSKVLLGKYPVHNFTPNNYKAGIQNIDFTQNRDMTIYVANNLGVLSYNGSQWQIHAFGTGKKQRSLSFDDRTNRLFVGSQGEFGYFEKDWEYVSLVDMIPEKAKDFDEVWDVILHESKVYFCTFQRIYVFDGKKIDVIQPFNGFNRTFSAGDKLFTQGTYGELYEIDKLDLRVIANSKTPNGIASGIIQDKDGYLILYNNGSIKQITPYGLIDKYPELSKVLKGKYVNHVMQLSDSRLVISTQTSGVFIFNKQTDEIENINVQEGLQSSACLNAFQDYAGNLWVGMQNGISLIDMNSPLRLINNDIGLQGSGYEAYEVDNGTYYTTSNGIYFLRKNSSKCVFLEGTEGPAYSIQEIFGNLYIGHHTGLFLIEDEKAIKVAATDGLWIVKQLRSRPEYAIAGTYSGLYLFKLNEKMILQPISEIKGFSESSRFFQEDQKGNILVGQFYKGLFKLVLSVDLDSSETIRVSDRYKLPINEHIFLSNIDNEIYIATEEGIFLLDQNTDQILKSDKFNDVVGDQRVYLLAQGNQKNIHLFTEGLVGYFKQISPSNYVYEPSSLFQLRHSFNNDLLNVSVNVKSGILFNANEGFIFYNPDLENRTQVENKPIISRLYSVGEDSVLYSRVPFGERVNEIQKIEISHESKVLQFKIESFNFKEFNNQQFRYYLKGFDNGYGQWSSTTTKEYTNLPEGNYEFQVQTLNHLGEETSSLPLMIVVTPPFYRTAYARVLYILLLILCFVALYKYQKIRLKKKSLQIDKAKELELNQKQEEVQELKEAKIESELRHVNNLLAASTMNLVVKNDFLETVKEELKQVKENGKILETKQALEQIVKEIDTKLRLKEDWKQFEYHFDKVHGDFLNRIQSKFKDLSPSEQKLCAFLRLNLNTKEIANLMGISSRGVEVARYRLRKKLYLNTLQNLSKFILEY